MIFKTMDRNKLKQLLKDRKIVMRTKGIHSSEYKNIMNSICARIYVKL